MGNTVQDILLWEMEKELYTGFHGHNYFVYSSLCIRFATSFHINVTNMVYKCLSSKNQIYHCLEINVYI